ncbi:MAG: amidophosphoribosyltransferase [Candidatus Omnitrophica bacterium]|nr:amidophosphoribosyltransferase [Candidatus Omnitrophota bacterium]
MCGVFGVFGHKEAANLTYLGLYALQHRGEESVGIASFNGKQLSYQKGVGLVSDVFDTARLKKLKGYCAVGHNRYSTTGSSVAENIQPIMVNHRKAPVVVAHNGNFTNTYELHRALEKEGAIFHTTMDSELIIHLLAREKSDDLKEKLIRALSQIKGAYSLVMMLGDNLIAARDPRGYRPLCIGKLHNAYVVSSETCALDLIGARYVRDVAPGEIIKINSQGLQSIHTLQSSQHAYCIFEYIYFSRPDSNIFGHNVYQVRKDLGRNLAREFPVQCDFAMPIPDSGNYAAVGFIQEAELPFEWGMIRNHYVGRTFIQPSQITRDFRVKVKLNPISDVLKDKNIVIIEDSIVRGTTSKIRVKTLREAGAKQIHMRVSCPPIRYPCFYGIDFPTKKELVASSKTVEEVGRFIGLDSLCYLSLEGMLATMPHKPCEFCTACFTGNYLEKPKKGVKKNILELLRR